VFIYNGRDYHSRALREGDMLRHNKERQNGIISSFIHRYDKI